MKRGQLPALFLVGLGSCFLLTAATAIGWWELNSAPSLGRPMYVSRLLTYYAPWDAFWWWWQWGDDQAFMVRFWEGVRNAFFFSALLALFVLHMVRSYGPLPHVEEEEQPNRWGDVDDLLRSKRISITKPGVVLGVHGREIVRHVGDDHVIVIGPSRTGEKGVSIVLPTLADSLDSIVCFDPKAELFEAVGDERAKLGPVYIFDATRPGSYGFNPIAEVRLDERNISDCRLFGLMLTQDAKGNDAFWSLKAGDLISGLIRAVCTDGGPRTLERVHHMCLSVAAGRPPATSDRYAREMIGAHMAMEHRPRSGVDAQAQLALSFAGDPVVAAATSRSDFTVADICAGDRPVTVFVTLPASQSEALRNLARTVIQGLLLGLLHSRNEASDGRKKTRRTLVLLDEFPQLGSMPILENALAVMAGYSAKALLVCQSIEQIKEAYGPNESIIGNCGTMAWIPGYSRDTHALATSAAGTMIAALRARHRKVGAVLDRPSETVSQSRHPTINMREAQLMGRDHVLVFHAGAHPTWLRKARYYEVPELRNRIKDTRPAW